MTSSVALSDPVDGWAPAVTAGHPNAASVRGQRERERERERGGEEERKKDIENDDKGGWRFGEGVGGGGVDG